MKQVKTLLFILSAIVICSCRQNQKKEAASTADTEKFAKGTFGFDLEFLKEKDSVIVLKTNNGKAQVIISPKYQAKVFTSTANGTAGKSFGWINYKTFTAKEDEHMNAYGGEDRLWLGPEGGKFSLYFKPGTKMDFANWHTPPAIDKERWETVSANDKEVAMSKTTQMLNYAHTLLKIKLQRHVKILQEADVKVMLGINAVNKVSTVAFTTVNTIINNGDKAWDKISGAPCLWNLDMFLPSEKTVIVVPYQENATGKVATTNYFGEILASRIIYDKGALLFKADGKSRGKLGMPPNRAKTMAGSYDPENKMLTIILFKVDSKAIYLNQEWTTEKPPFAGDAVNAYNDGPLATGGQMGPFYEIESVSPAAFLKPGEKLTHQHSVFHFTGDEAQLNAVALKTLGISLKDIQAAFK